MRKNALKIKVLAMALAVCFLLSGCMAAEFAMVFNEDGSGTITIGSYLADAAIEQLKESGTTGNDEDFTVHKTINGQPYSGSVETKTFKTIDELKEMLMEDEDEESAEAQDASSEMRSFDITQSVAADGTPLVTIKMVVEMESEGIEVDPAFAEEMESTMSALFSITMEATFPGGIIEVNAPKDCYKIEGNKIIVNMMSSNEEQTISFTGALKAPQNNTPAPAAGLFASVRSYTDIFADVAEDAWYHDELALCYSVGIINGTTTTTFTPGGTLTLGHIATMCARIHSAYIDDQEQFAVIVGKPWYQPYVTYLEANGILKENEFADYTRPATRAEMAHFIYICVPEDALAVMNDVQGFDDAKTGPYVTEINALKRAGICAGIGNNMFGPESNLTRAQAAVFLARVLAPDTRVVIEK